MRRAPFVVLALVLMVGACERIEAPLAPVPCTPGTADTAVVIVINGVPYKEVVQCGDSKKK